MRCLAGWHVKRLPSFDRASSVVHGQHASSATPRAEACHHLHLFLLFLLCCCIRNLIHHLPIRLASLAVATSPNHRSSITVRRETRHLLDELSKADNRFRTSATDSFPKPPRTHYSDLVRTRCLDCPSANNLASASAFEDCDCSSAPCKCYT